MIQCHETRSSVNRHAKGPWFPVVVALAFAVLPAVLLVTAVSAAFWGFLGSLGKFFDKPGVDVETMRYVIDRFISIAIA